MAEKSNKIFTIPNLLSFLRIVCVPFFGYYFYKGEYLIACGILALSGLSDFFDGKIARAFNQVSDLGKMLDPVADKLTEMTLAVLFFLTFKNSANPLYNNFLCWVFLFFVAKEILMLLIGAILLLCKYKPVAAEIYGKLATFCFYFIMIAIMAFGPEIGIVPLNVPKLAWMEIPQWITVALVITSALLTFVALLSYIPPVLKQITESKNKTAEEVPESETEQGFTVNSDVEIAEEQAVDEVKTGFTVNENFEPENEIQNSRDEEPAETEAQPGFSVTFEEKAEYSEIQDNVEKIQEETEIDRIFNMDVDSIIDRIMDEVLNNKQ